MRWIGWIVCGIGGAACMLVLFILILIAANGHPWGLAAAAAGGFIGWWVPWLLASLLGIPWNQKKGNNQ